MDGIVKGFKMHGFRVKWKDFGHIDGWNGPLLDLCMASWLHRRIVATLLN